MSWDWLGSQIGSCIQQGWESRSRSQKARRTGTAIPGRVEGLEQRLVLTATSDEQLFVYLLNKIRHDPQAYDTEANLGGILSAVEPRQPLAVNDDLFASARFHAVEMADHNYFGHQSQVTQDWPNKMARDQGYQLPDFFPDDSNYIESIAAGNAFGKPADVIKLLIVDAGIPSLGHRNHLLGIDSFNEQATEIGVGHGFNLASFYDHYWAAHITFSDPDDVFLTGVVYQDANSDQEFDLNEGLAGVSVSIASQALQTQTNAAGGWSIKVPGPGSYTVTVSGGAFSGTAASVVQVNADNREVDFTSGQTSGVIDFEASPPGTNAPPVNTLPIIPFVTQEDVPFNIDGISVSDPDAGSGSISVTLSVAHGTIAVKTNVSGGITSQQVAGNNSIQVVLTAPLARINATLASLQGVSYQSVSNFNGTDSLTVLTNDQGNSGTGGAQVDIDSIDIVVNAVNDPPINTVPTGPLSVITGVTLDVMGLGLAYADLGVQPAVVTLTVMHGILTVRTDVASGLTAADVTNNGSDSVSITAPLSRLLPTFTSVTGISFVSDNGYSGPDTLTMMSSDQGQSGQGPVGTDLDSVVIQVQTVPIAPTITLPDTILTSSRGAAVIVGAGATISDPDSPNFQNGRLTIQITNGAAGKDVLTLNKVGTKSGQLNLRNSDVRLGKTVIGRLSGGAGGSPLVIQFTSNVTLATVQTVLRNVTLRGKPGRLTSGTRTISFVAKDPTQLSSLGETRQVSVP